MTLSTAESQQIAANRLRAQARDQGAGNPGRVDSFDCPGSPATTDNPERKASLNTNLQRTSILDYFEHPSCSADAADRAYQQYLAQGFLVTRQFSDWLEAEAWSQVVHGAPVVTDR